MNYYIAPKEWGMPTDGGAFSYEVFQGDQPACAVYSQYNVLRDYGYTGTPEDLIKEATEYGWYDPANGTSLENLGKLLESHGVPCDLYVNANRYNLFEELAKGKRVIVTVDSGELWADGKMTKLGELLEDILPDGADHALVVSGLDTSDPDNVKVILTDSGSGQNAVEYPVAEFEDAWRDGGCTMVVPREPPPFDNPALVNLIQDVGEGMNRYFHDTYSEIVDQYGIEDASSYQLPQFDNFTVPADADWQTSAQEYYQS
jgi:hypothetical protein